MSIYSGYPDVPNSITNAKALDVNIVDKESPLPFSKFTSIVNYYFIGDIREYYDFYIKKWNFTYNNKVTDNENDILLRYKNFLKEISLRFKTIEEEDYLTKIDYDDVKDLEASIPFFTEKIKEISKYYEKRREDVKNKNFENKMMGTTLGIKNTIRDFTLNYIKNLPNAPILYDLDNIDESLTVEIDEFFDTYPTYFNQTPDERVYDYKDIDYGLDIFLKADDYIINEIFDEVSSEIKSLKELAILFELKRRETKKNIGTNFFFLSTGKNSSDFLSGSLFESDNPVRNLFNQKYPTTATTPKKVLKSVNDIGFFKPQKSGILLVDGERNNFSINIEKLQPNSLYYFSNPLVSGTGDFLEIQINYNKLIKNPTSGKSAFEPLISKNDIIYHGYSSEPYLDNEQRYFQKIFDLGYVKDLKRDIYGNIYGLFSNDDNFKLTVEKSSDVNIVKSLILGGHDFYDDLYGEGFSFDYTVVDNQPVNFTTRSGLSSNTGNFSNLSGRYTLFGRYFSPYDELIDPRIEEYDYKYYDGGFIFSGDDPISSDLDEFPSNDPYYYTLLLEGGIHTSNPLQRALLDPLYPSLTANASESFIPNNDDAFLIDCGSIIDNFTYKYFTNPNNYYYDNTLLDDTELDEIKNYEIESFIIRKNLNGVMFVKNVTTGKIDTLSNSIPYLSSIYNSNILQDIENSTILFEILGDCLILETSNYFTIFKIGYNDGSFTDPKNSPIIHEIGNNEFNVVSERFAHDGKIYYNKLTSNSYPSLNMEFDLNFYSLDTKKFRQRLIHSEKFNTNDDHVIYSSMTRPTLTYKKSSNVFNMSALLKDQNHFFDILDINYKTTPYEIKHIKIHKNETNSFSNLNLSTLNLIYAPPNLSTPQPYIFVL